MSDANTQPTGKPATAAKAEAPGSAEGCAGEGSAAQVVRDPVGREDDRSENGGQAGGAQVQARQDETRCQTGQQTGRTHESEPHDEPDDRKHDLREQ